MSSIKHGDPLTAEKDKLGPQADDIQGKSVLNYISIGQKDGKVLTGGNRVGTQVCFCVIIMYINELAKDC